MALSQLLSSSLLPNRANSAALLQQQLSDMQQAQTINTQMAAEAQKNQTQRWALMSDLQTKIHEMTTDVTIRKAKTADKLHEKLSRYIQS